MLHGIHTNYEESALHTAKLFNFFLRVLPSLDLPARGSEDDIAMRAQLGLSDSIEDASFIASWLGKLILFSTTQVEEKRCPGLSMAEFSFLKLHDKEDPWRPDAVGSMNLTESKILAIKFLASGAFVDSERFLPALFASAEPNSRLSELGNDILKRSISSISLEDHHLLEQLFQIYLGTRGTDGSLPARVPLQTKILGLLSRSKLASSFVEQSIQIIHEGLIPIDSDTTMTGGFTSLKPGLETSKFRLAVFAFTNWLARISPSASITAFAPTLVSQLRAYIESQGWPQIRSENSRPHVLEVEARVYCYESIGLLAAACPDLLVLQPDLDLLRWLFTSLSADPSGNSVSLSVEQALGSILGALGQDLDARMEESLTRLLLYYMDLRPEEDETDFGYKVVRSARFIALRFTNRCLPFKNVTARWIDILALRDEMNDRSEMKEEGRKGLDPYWYRMWNPLEESATATNEGRISHQRYQFPEFHALVEKFFGLGAEWEIRNAKAAEVKVTKAYGSAIVFCRSVLLNQALSSTQKAPKLNADWERNINALVLNDEECRTHIKVFLEREYLAKSSTSDALDTYLAASFYGLVNHASGDSNESGECLLQLCSLGCDQVLDGVTSMISDLERSIVSNHKPIRETAAHVFGIVASRPNRLQVRVEAVLQRFHEKIKNWAQAIGREIFETHGAILATAYFISRASYRGNMESNLSDLRPHLVNLLFDILNNCRDKLLLEAATIAVSEFGLFGIISPDTIPPPLKLASLIEKLKEQAKSGDEKAIMALGSIAMQCDEIQGEGAELNQIINILYSLHEVRQPEVQFAVGASLTCAAAGWSSKALIATFDIQGPPPPSRGRRTTLPEIISKVLLDCRKTKPALRQASVIWLLCLVQYCGHSDDVQSRLRECQSAFTGFLADRDSLNQESASRGLTLVYEKGDRSVKDDLIRDLIGSFTGSGKTLAGKVSEETELFEPGALPTGEGSVTTYKDIMNLASEVGDPGLVYKFMSLASNNAIWSSRAAFGRFGLSNILSDSSVDGYLAQNPKLYPALFRYRFDPNPNVRHSMNEIWSALVKEPAVTVGLYFDNIMEDLLKNILGREWRVRQASCAAIADLLQGRPVEKYEGYVSRIWTNAFKVTYSGSCIELSAKVVQVCDDIKGSVRAEAMKLAKVLTGTLTRTLQASNSPSRGAVAMLEQVVPFLLSPSGLESSAADVQLFALHTLLEIIKHSSSDTLRPFIPDMISHLLALLSSLEPDVMNYIHLNAERYAIERDEIDDARLSIVKGSPIMEAIERCLDFVDDATMAAFAPRLEDTMKTAIGLPSKVGTTRVLVSLSTRQNVVFRPYADEFITLARKQVLDRNDTVSSAFAAACGYLARLASDAEILKLFAYCQQLYFDCDEDRQRKISGDIVYAVSKHATDRFHAVASEVLPFVFVAKHDGSPPAKSYFQDSWNENVGGSRAVLLYLPEISSLVTTYLDSPRWSIKHTSALATADLIISLGDPIHDAHAQSVWPILEKALSGKTWEGKETVLAALVHLVKCSHILTLGDGLARPIEGIVFRECKRNNPAYRRHALACLEDFVDIHRTKDLYAPVHAIIQPVVEEILGDAGEMDIDGSAGGPSSQTIREGTLACSMGALLKSINPQLQRPEDLTSTLTQAFDLTYRVMSQDGNRAAVHAIYDGYITLFGRIAHSTAIPSSNGFENVLLRYVDAFVNPEGRVEETRVKSAEAVTAMAPVAVHSDRVTVALLDALGTTRAHERSVVVQQSLDRARQRLEER